MKLAKKYMKAKSRLFLRIFPAGENGVARDDKIYCGKGGLQA
jgi:hypothetical protein